jgi:succinate dehydrogenase / fumarate reductase, cytochrome b subunit
LRNLSNTSGRPRSPNIQLYRPQLTSVLSIVHRITGLALVIAAIGLVGWLTAAAEGPHTYGVVRSALTSAAGRIVLFTITFAFFLHLCGGIRHLAWDAGYGFELRAIYRSGWAVVAANLVLTLAAWLPGLFVLR